MAASIPITVDLPRALVGDRAPAELADEIRALAVVLAWQRRELSQGQAVRLLGMDRVDFHEWLLARGLPTTTYGAADLEADLATHPGGQP